MTTAIDVHMIGNVIGFLTACIAVNATLNIFYEIKRAYGLERYDRPFDMGWHLFGNRLLGQSTTWGGLIICLVFGLVLHVVPGMPGLTIGLGCFFGHAMGSFIKRRFGFPRGAYFPFVDHGDYVIFTGFLMVVGGYLTAVEYAFSIIIILIVHPLLCLAAYKMGFRDNPL
jgi:CDP-2,3-bis-(O-geranylgeranyl)-sn-glycerol synthase